MDQVSADALVAVEEAREIELRANAVGGRDEDRVRPCESKKPAERTNVADDLRPVRGADAIADPSQGIVPARDVDARVLVPQRTLSSTSFVSSSCTGTR